MIKLLIKIELPEKEGQNNQWEGSQIELPVKDGQKEQEEVSPLSVGEQVFIYEDKKDNTARDGVGEKGDLADSEEQINQSDDNKDSQSKNEQSKESGETSNEVYGGNKGENYMENDGDDKHSKGKEQIEITWGRTVSQEEKD